MKLHHLCCLLVGLIVSNVAALGQTFRPLLNVQSYTVLTNPIDPQKAIIGSWSNRLYRTNDYGESWSMIAVGTPGVATNFYMSVVQSSADTSVLIAGGFNVDGIRRSVNSGQTWERALNDPDFRRMFFISDAIVPDPTSTRSFVAARGEGGNTLYRSADNGATWDSVSSVPQAITSRICTITVRPDSAQQILLGCKGGIIMRSSDSGLTWQRASIAGRPGIKSDTEFPKIVYSPTVPNRVYAVAAIGLAQNRLQNGGLWRSDDAGASWSLIAFPDTSLWALEIYEKNGVDQIWVGGFRISNLSTVVPGAGIVARSVDDGATWRYFNDDIPWGKSEDDDSLRNCWIFRYDRRSSRLYLAMQTGTFAFDESTSYVPNMSAKHRTLQLHAGGNDIHVVDATPPSHEQRWELYTAAGESVASGVYLPVPEQHLNVPQLHSGWYLIRIGTDEFFRSTAIPILR